MISLVVRLALGMILATAASYFIAFGINDEREGHMFGTIMYGLAMLLLNSRQDMFETKIAAKSKDGSLTIVLTAIFIGAVLLGAVTGHNVESNREFAASEYRPHIAGLMFTIYAASVVLTFRRQSRSLREAASGADNNAAQE